MKIKESLLLSALAPFVCMSNSAQAAPLVSIGDNIDVFFNGSTSLQWMSNVYQDEHDEEDDTKFTVSPGFEVNFGRGASNLDLSVITRYDIIRYDDLSHLDDELFHIKTVGSYQSSRWDVSGLVSYDEQQATTGDGGGQRGKLSESDKTEANLNGEYRLSPKFSVGSGVNYSYLDYTNDDSLADTETVTVPVDVYYELTPKVDLSVGYQYKATDVDGTKNLVNNGSGDTGSTKSSYDKNGHFFNVGARGELLPKLTGFFKVGYRYNDSDDSNYRQYVNGVASAPTISEGGSDGMLGFDSDLTYLLTPKVTTRLHLHRGFNTGSQGQTTENTSADLSATYSINANYSASANFGYTYSEYEDNDNREDNRYDTGVSFSYVPSQYWRFSTGYNYADNDSNRKGESYQAHTVNLSASLRY